MGRVHRRKLGSRNYKNYTEASVENAVKDVIDGTLSIRGAAKKYGVPFGTLNNRSNANRFNEEGRLMSKRGRIHVYLSNIPDKSIRYVLDLWNTLVNMRWRWILLTVTLVNVFAYLTFAILFMLDAWVSGDFDKVRTNLCVVGAQNFTSFFMLGIETITTTGYGYFHPTEHCRLVFLVLTLSTFATIFIDGAFISVVYFKFSRPTSRGSSGLFTKKAIVSLRNGKLCLIFRINDKTGKHWINNQISMFLIKDHFSKDGELLPSYMVQIKLNPHGTLFWPVEIVHEINEDSPLWDVSASDLMMVKFELLAVIVGCSVSTGQLSQSQTSYLSEEILWGFCFSPCLEFDVMERKYVVNHRNFQRTVLRDTPLCSARHLKDVEKDICKLRLSFDYSCIDFVNKLSL